MQENSLNLAFITGLAEGWVECRPDYIVAVYSKPDFFLIVMTVEKDFLF